MTTPDATSSQHRPYGLLWRLVALLACTVASGLALALVYVASSSLMPVTFSLLSAAAIGLVAGLSGRWLLRERGELLRITSAFASVALSMTFLGWLSSGRAGVLFRSHRPAIGDWSSLILLALGWMTSWLALRAWRMPKASGGLPAPVPPDDKPGKVSRNRRAPSTKLPAGARPPGLRKHPPRARPVNPPRFLRRRARHISLVGKTEHRCPYCLEAIRRRDPRGVVVCPECKTPHHADCWAVTGMCQIPHQHP